MCHRLRTAVPSWMGLGLALLSAAPTTAQVAFSPLPSGRQLQAGDGDTIVVDGDDRVSVVRRRQARVRVVADESARTVLVIADWGTRASAQPDGRVNRTWRFAGIDGRWPLESRWEGDAVLMVPEMPPLSAGPSLSIETPAGSVAFVGGPLRPVTDTAVVLHYESVSGGGREGVTFDEAEREALSPNFMTSFSTMSFGSAWNGYVAGGTTGAAGSLEPGGSVQRRAAPPGPGPILRAMPHIIERVKPEWPQAARDAGAVGTVILQADVTLDGTVRDVRVVRGVPMLDNAAIEAVRRWRFEPAGPEGRLDPVTVTVTVQFLPQP